MSSLRRLECKLRFALSKLPFFPVMYTLTLDEVPVKRIIWSKIMPFFDHSHSLFHMELWGWDVPELRFIWRFCKPGMVFFDVGAHHGLYSVVAACRLGRSGSVVAFEPNPADSRRIRFHSLLNRFFCSTAPTEVETLAISDRSGISEFHVPVSGVKTTAALKKPNDIRSRFKKLQVRTVTLDTYLAQRGIRRLDILKLDIEGAEMLFLDGANQTLLDLRPILIVEAIDEVSLSWGHSGRDLLMRIRDQYGYQLFSFDDSGLLELHSLQSVYPLTSRCNYLAIPEATLSSLPSELFVNADSPFS